jgi:hypothetical protein
MINRMPTGECFKADESMAEVWVPVVTIKGGSGSVPSYIQRCTSGLGDVNTPNIPSYEIAFMSNSKFLLPGRPKPHFIYCLASPETVSKCGWQGRRLYAILGQYSTWEPRRSLQYFQSLKLSTQAQACIVNYMLGDV